MVRVWRVRPKEGGPWLLERELGKLAEFLDDETSIGRSFELELVEMTEAELAAVGEFDGW